MYAFPRACTRARKRGRVQPFPCEGNIARETRYQINGVTSARGFPAPISVRNRGKAQPARFSAALRRLRPTFFPRARVTRTWKRSHGNTTLYKYYIDFSARGDTRGNAYMENGPYSPRSLSPPPPSAVARYR